MKTIHKFEVPIQDEFELNLPIDSEILCFQVQNNKPYLWIKLYVKAKGVFKHEIRTFKIIGTGWVFEDSDLKYIGTIQQFDGDLVWHLFEVIK